MKQGYLTKLGFENTKWKKRYFVLVGENVQYYSSQAAYAKQKPARGIVRMALCTKIEKIETGTTLRSKQSNAFNPKNKMVLMKKLFLLHIIDGVSGKEKRSVIVSCSSAAERDNWLSKMQSVIKELKPVDTKSIVLQRRVKEVQNMTSKILEEAGLQFPDTLTEENIREAETEHIFNSLKTPHLLSPPGTQGMTPAYNMQSPDATMGDVEPPTPYCKTPANYKNTPLPFLSTPPETPYWNPHLQFVQDLEGAIPATPDLGNQENVSPMSPESLALSQQHLTATAIKRVAEFSSPLDTPDQEYSRPVWAPTPQH